MGAASSMFINLVLRVCWACRLYFEHFDRSSLSLAATPGFLNTPEATSTPLSPSPTSSCTALVPASTARHRSTSTQMYQGVRKPKKHSLSEILSPIEEEMIRAVMSKGCSALRIGITPSLPKRGVVRHARRGARGVVLSPGPRGCVPLGRAEREDFRKRGLRL